MVEYVIRCCFYIKMKFNLDGYDDNIPEDIPVCITERNEPERELSKDENMLTDLIALGYINNNYDELYDLPKNKFKFKLPIIEEEGDEDEDKSVETVETVFRTHDKDINNYRRLSEKYVDVIIRIAHVYRWDEMDFPDIRKPRKNDNIWGVYVSEFEYYKERYNHYNFIPESEFSDTDINE
jgi:hypothetical protein